MYTSKKIKYDMQDNKGQHLEDGRDAFQKQEVSSHQAMLIVSVSALLRETLPFCSTFTFSPPECWI